METVNVRLDALKRVIGNLETAVNVCQEVDGNQGDDPVKTYPYATGYSRSAMTYAIIDLQDLIAK